MDNPAGDIESVSVRVNPEGTFTIVVNLVSGEGEFADSTGMILEENAGGITKTYLWHKKGKDVDKGEASGSSDGRPIIVRDALVDYGSFTFPPAAVPTTEAELNDYFVEYGIWMFTLNAEGEMSKDEVKITNDDMSLARFYLKFGWGGIGK